MIPKKILLVDDDKELVYGMSVWLKSKGFQVLSATDVTSAVTLSKAEKPDLVILNGDLPDGEGYSMMARFRNLMLPAQLPMIITTAGNASILREKALQSGARAFFQKPFDSRRLLVAVQRALMDGPSEPPEKEISTNQKKILIVDDNQDFLHALQVRLKFHGFKVHFTPDAALAIHIALKIKPDLVILGADLPGGEGYSTIERLRSQSALAHIPFIIIDGEASLHQNKAPQTGAEAFFSKPIDHRQLLAAIHKALGDGRGDS